MPTPINFSIAPAWISDAPDIARLSLELGYPTDVDTTIAVLERMLASVNYLAIVAAASNQQLLGWAVAERRLSLAACRT